MMYKVVHQPCLTDALVGTLITSEYLRFPVIIISVDRDACVAASATGDVLYPFAIFDIRVADERHMLWRICWAS